MNKMKKIKNKNLLEISKLALNCCQHNLVAFMHSLFPLYLQLIVGNVGTCLIIQLHFHFQSDSQLIINKFVGV